MMANDEEISDWCADCRADPLRFVNEGILWGEGELEGWDGPDAWQAETLATIGEEVRKRRFDGVRPVDPIRMATASGHGIGKTALTVWIILWIASTRPRSKGVVTANTSSQLETKTWAELAKWLKRCATGHWFKLTSGKMSMRLAHKDDPEGWRCDALTCREENSEAFAGLHAADSTAYYLFDEASAVPNVIYDVAEGGMTDGEPMHFVWGNPTRNIGRFRELFGKFRHRWITRQIDSRDAKLPNKAKIAEWVKDYGEDSDFVRVRVRGVFPRAGSLQFIPSDAVSDAVAREGQDNVNPIVFGVDVARFGDDASIIAIRRGRDAQSLPWKVFRNVDTMTLAAAIVDLAHLYRPKAIYVDEGGVGGGVVDRLRFLAQPVQGIQFGSAADRLNTTGGHVYANERAEMWGSMREWLKGGVIPPTPELIADLVGVEYGYVMKNGVDAIQLEKKEDMKKRGLASTDFGDALALTFAYPISEAAPERRARHRTVEEEYNPFREPDPYRTSSHTYDYNPFDN
jgi:hypothetical protein